MRRVRDRGWVLAMCGGVILSGAVAGCAAEAEGEPQADEQVTFSSTEQAITAVAGAPPPGTDPDVFTDALAAFATVETINDGLGPIFNEHGCGVCHTQG